MNKNKLELLKLHENKNYLKNTCSLINSYWPRSEVARLHSLNNSKNGYPTNFILVNTENDNVIGHVCVHKNKFFDDKIAYIETLIIDENLRGKGLGRFLMNLIEKILFNDGFEWIILKTINQLDFYISLGFKIKREEKVIPLITNSSETKLNLNKNSFINNEKNIEEIKVNIGKDQSKDQCFIPPPPPPPISKQLVNLTQNVYWLEKQLI